MELTNEQIANSFKIRCSALYDICAGEIGLTEKQETRLQELHQRFIGNGKPLTPNMEAEYNSFLVKKNNPELPQGAKTYC